MRLENPFTSDNRFSAAIMAVTFAYIFSEKYGRSNIDRTC